MKNIPFLETLYTKHDAAVLLDTIETLEKSLYNVKLPIEEAVSQVFSFAQLQEFLAHVGQSGVSLTSPDSLRKYLDTIKADIQSLPVATVKIAVTPTNDTLKYITKWFDTNIGERVLLDIEVDHTLIAGVVIEYNGKHADYSLKKLLVQRLNKRGDAQGNNTQSDRGAIVPA